MPSARTEVWVANSLPNFARWNYNIIWYSKKNKGWGFKKNKTEIKGLYSLFTLGLNFFILKNDEEKLEDI